jgi:hypothetical protein
MHKGNLVFNLYMKWLLESNGLLINFSFRIIYIYMYGPLNLVESEISPLTHRIGHPIAPYTKLSSGKIIYFRFELLFSKNQITSFALSRCNFFFVQLFTDCELAKQLANDRLFAGPGNIDPNTVINNTLFRFIKFFFSFFLFFSRSNVCFRRRRDPNLAN